MQPQHPVQLPQLRPDAPLLRRHLGPQLPRPLSGDGMDAGHLSRPMPKAPHPNPLQRGGESALPPTTSAHPNRIGTSPPPRGEGLGVGGWRGDLAQVPEQGAALDVGFHGLPTPDFHIVRPTKTQATAKGPIHNRFNNPRRAICVLSAPQTPASRLYIPVAMTIAANSTSQNMITSDRINMSAFAAKTAIPSRPASSRVVRNIPARTNTTSK